MGIAGRSHTFRGGFDVPEPPPLGRPCGGGPPGRVRSKPAHHRRTRSRSVRAPSLSLSALASRPALSAKLCRLDLHRVAYKNAMALLEPASFLPIVSLLELMCSTHLQCISF